MLDLSLRGLAPNLQKNIKLTTDAKVKWTKNALINGTVPKRTWVQSEARNKIMRISRWWI